MKKIISAIVVVCLVKSSFAVLRDETQFGDTMLRYYNDHDDWIVQSGAIARCMQLNGELVMPKYQSLNAAVATLTRGDSIWIGMGDWGAEDSYEWLDGSRLEWADWDSKQPDDARGQEDCVMMVDNGYWNDDTCGDHFGYVCQIPIAAPVRAFSHYVVSSEVATYSQARQMCEQTGYRLARSSFGNADEIRGIVVGTQRYWVEDEDRGDDFCYTVSVDGTATEKCDQRLSYVCEGVEPHDIHVAADDPVVEEASHFEIDCSASGSPAPDVTWFLKGAEVPNQIKASGQSTLVLNGVTKADYGVYECHGTNVVEGVTYSKKRYSVVQGPSEDEENRE